MQREAWSGVHPREQVCPGGRAGRRNSRRFIAAAGPERPGSDDEPSQGVASLRANNGNLLHASVREIPGNPRAEFDSSSHICLAPTNVSKLIQGKASAK